MSKKPITPHQRRNELARKRGFSTYAQQRSTNRNITNRADLAKLPTAAQHTRQKALDALALARREGLDIATAAKRESVSIEAATYWAGDAVTRTNGRLAPAPADRLYRPMYIYSAGQPVTIDVRGSKAASTIGRYHSAIQHYLSTGDSSRLTRLSGLKVGGFELETDVDVLDEMARRGSFEFESIYRMVN